MWTFFLSVIGAIFGFLTSLLLQITKPNLFHFDGDIGFGALAVILEIIVIHAFIGMVIGFITDYIQARRTGKTIYSSIFIGVIGIIIFVLFCIFFFI